jgi:peptidoglycan hydrolase-like protein with peptidoglycan-binding domain
MAFPSPRSLPGFWDTAVLGEFVLPPVAQRGSCDVRVTPSIKKDDKKKPGKDKANVSVERVEPAKIEVVFRFNEEIWAQVEPTIAGLKPDGKPRDIAHPMAQLYGIGAMMIEQASPLEFNDGIGEITWSGEEWTAPAAQGQPVILRRGSTGPEVSRWQTFLTEQKFGEVEGFSPIDGIFGILTEDGTKGFQTREAIKVDGIVGPETFGAASKYGYVPPPPIQGGAGGGGGVKTPEDAVAAALTDAAGAVADAAGEVADTVTDAVQGLLGGDDGENAGVAGGSADDADGV